MIRALSKSSFSTSKSGNVTLTPGYRINCSQRRRITRHVRPGLEVHGLSRANAHQNTQHFHIGGPLRQRRVKAVATLFNGWEVKCRSIRDRLQEIGIAGIGIGAGNRRVLFMPRSGRPAGRQSLDQDPGYACRRGSASTNSYPA